MNNELYRNEMSGVELVAEPVKFGINQRASGVMSVQTHGRR